MSIGCYHRLPRAARQSIKLTSLVYKTPTVGVPGRRRSRTVVAEKEAMAPCTYVGLALGTAPGGCIRFGSLKFTDIDGPAPVNGLLPAKPCTLGT